MCFVFRISVLCLEIERRGQKRTSYSPLIASIFSCRSVSAVVCLRALGLDAHRVLVYRNDNFLRCWLVRVRERCEIGVGRSRCSLDAAACQRAVFGGVCATAGRPNPADPPPPAFLSGRGARFAHARARRDPPITSLSATTTTTFMSTAHRIEVRVILFTPPYTAMLTLLPCVRCCCRPARAVQQKQQGPVPRRAAVQGHAHRARRAAPRRRHVRRVRRDGAVAALVRPFPPDRRPANACVRAGAA